MVEIGIPKISVVRSGGEDQEWDNKQIKEGQATDVGLGFIRRWLDQRIEPSEAELSLASPESKFYWINKELFFMEEGVIFRKGEGEKDLLVIPKSLKQEVLKGCHDIPSAAHQGVDRTKTTIRNTYFWYRMSRDIEEFVKGCVTCNRNKGGQRKNIFPLVQSHAGTPMEKIHIDFMGPYPLTKKGNRSILVIVDQFTKWIEVIPLPSQTAEVTARAAVNEFFSRFGYPLNLMSDQGTNFESDLFKEMCKLLKIHKARTTSYRPSANGQAERMNRTILAAIRSFISKQQNDWDEFLPQIAAALRSSVNRSTGYTPNKLMLGREINTPVELMIPGANHQPKHTSEYVNNLEKQMLHAHETARATLKVTQERSKRDYDLRARTSSFDRGEAVLYLDKSSRPGQCKKLTPIWVGPGVITTVLSPCLYRVQFRNREVKVLHHDYLRKCTDGALPSWVTRAQREIRENVQAVYCICGKPDDGWLMIQCDNCLDWFHGGCMQISKSKASKMKSFICPDCMTK